MEQNEVQLIHTELCRPKKRFIRSDGGLFAVVLLGVLLVVGFGSNLASLFGIEPAVMHWILYAVLIAVSVLLYRTRLLSWRYTLTSAGFFVDRVSGRREKPEVEIPLKDIFYCGPYSAERLKREGCSAGPNVRSGKLEDTVMVLYKSAGRTKAVCITPGGTLREKLEEPWKESI